ncbi:MAG: hypothetical protein WD904_13265 [Dehalococcoidia bacterium]
MPPTLAGSPGLIRAFQAVAGLIAVLVFLQAILAGQFLYSEPDLKDVHEMVGNFLVLAAIAQLALAWLTRDSWRYKMVIWSALILVLIIAQTGLGYSGRDEPDIAALHIPLGVFIFSLTSIVAMLAGMDEKAKTAVRAS